MRTIFLTACILAACDTDRAGGGEQWWEECHGHWEDPIECEEDETACLDGEYSSQWVIYCDCGRWEPAIDCAAYQGRCDEDIEIVSWCYDVGGYDVIDDWFGTQEEPRCEQWLESIEMLTYLCRTRIFEKCAVEYCD